MAQHYVCCRLRTTEPPAALLPVTNLADSGVDTETIMRIVGHSSVQMFLRYRTIKAETLDAAMTRLNTLKHGMRTPLAKPSESLHYRVVGAEGGIIPVLAIAPFLSPPCGSARLSGAPSLPLAVGRLLDRNEPRRS